MGWHSFVKKAARASIGFTLGGPMGAIAAVDKRAGIGLATGGLSEVMYYQPKENAERVAVAQKEANRQAEAVAAREAGNAPQATNQNDLLDIRKKKSAMRRAIYTASTSESKKLGD